MNVLNLSDLTKGKLDSGLLEMRLGGGVTGVLDKPLCGLPLSGAPVARRTRGTKRLEAGGDFPLPKAHGINV
jgi:hypothetical protein